MGKIKNLTELQVHRQLLGTIEKIQELMEDVWYAVEGKRVDAIDKHLEIISEELSIKVNKAEKKFIKQ